MNMEKEHNLILNVGTETYVFPFNQIVYIDSINGENWCCIHTEGIKRPETSKRTPSNNHALYIKQKEKPEYENAWEIPILLGHVYEKIVAGPGINYYQFQKCGRSLIINMSYFHKIDVAQKIILLAGKTFNYKVHASRDSLISLRDVIISDTKVDNNNDEEVEEIIEIAGKSFNDKQALYYHDHFKPTVFIRNMLKKVINTLLLLYTIYTICYWLLVD